MNIYTYIYKYKSISISIQLFIPHHMDLCQREEGRSVQTQAWKLSGWQNKDQTVVSGRLCGRETFFSGRSVCGERSVCLCVSGQMISTELKYEKKKQKKTTV